MRLWVQGLLGSYVISNLENKKEELSVFDDRWMCILTVFLSLSLSLWKWPSQIPGMKESFLWIKF